jgi:hypothetical protein
MATALVPDEPLPLPPVVPSRTRLPLAPTLTCCCPFAASLLELEGYEKNVTESADENGADDTTSSASIIRAAVAAPTNAIGIDSIDCFFPFRALSSLL